MRLTGEAFHLPLVLFNNYVIKAWDESFANFRAGRSPHDKTLSNSLCGIFGEMGPKSFSILHPSLTSPPIHSSLIFSHGIPSSMIVRLWVHFSTLLYLLWFGFILTPLFFFYEWGAFSFHTDHDLPFCFHLMISRCFLSMQCAIVVPNAVLKFVAVVLGLCREAQSTSLQPPFLF